MENFNILENATKIFNLVDEARKKWVRAEVMLYIANRLPYISMPFPLISRAKKLLKESLKNLEEAQELIEKDPNLDSVSIKNKINIEKAKKAIEKLNIDFEKLKTAVGV